MNDDRYQVVEAGPIVRAMSECRKNALWAFMEIVGVMPFYNASDGGQMVVVDADLEGRLMAVADIGSRKTLGDLLRELCAAGVMRKVRNGTYQVNPHFAYRGDGYYRAAACARWNKTMAGVDDDLPY